MAERSILLSQLLKLSVSRNAAKFLLLLSDLGGAIIVGTLVHRLLPPLQPPDHVFQIWFLSLAVIWMFTFDLDRHFRIDSYLTFTRVLKITFYTSFAYLIFFMFMREPYSLKFLLLANIFWLGWASFSRGLVSKFSPPVKILAFEALPKILERHHKVSYTITQELKKINLHDFDFLLIDFKKQYSTECQELLTHAHAAGVPLLSVPQLIEHLFGKVSIDHFSDYWVEATFYINPFYLRLKRLFDIALTCVLLPIILPLIAIISLLILISMGRPIFYWQERMGLDDKLFKMVKFRTMVHNAEKIGSGSTEKNDTRVTVLGAVLRKWRLDELPQFYNVLVGNMSIIGPRPEYHVLVNDFMKNIPLFQIRHWLRPGITGWAQVLHGYAKNQDEMMNKVRYDLYYLKNFSFWLDLIIIFRTMITILTGFGSR